ncbi:MAG TPA: oxidoreductase, partial [Candidatus Angelobacter sp.]|nr:oxidoreductase [Candidatus Angelobacter sp.]
MRTAAVLSITLFLAQLACGQKPQNSGVDVQLRGISAIPEKVAWASGAKGTVLRTVDGGATWQRLEIVGAEALDFRDIQAFDQNTAFVLSIGPGEQSRIYKTADGGKIWQRQFTNSDPKAFYDCFAFWDSTHGIAVSDSVDGKFPLIATTDGMNWNPVAVKKMPEALPAEGAFAASGTCIATFGKNEVWFGTGGPAARVFHSADRGLTWTVAETPIIHGAATQGIFSLAFWTAKDGVAVGGDYKEPTKNES